MFQVPVFPQHFAVAPLVRDDARPDLVFGAVAVGTARLHQNAVCDRVIEKCAKYVFAGAPDFLAGVRIECVELCLVAYNLGEGAIRLVGEVLDQNGTLVAENVSIGLVERTITGINGLDKLVATFQPSGEVVFLSVFRVAELVQDYH